MALTLAPIFSVGMILQHELPVRVWGLADPGERVEVAVQGRVATCAAGEDGSWSCTLPPLAASDDETLEVRAGAEAIALGDVAVGEVFVAGGQSNMEFWMRYDRQLEDCLPTCDNPRIRFFDQPKCSYPGQLDDFDYSRVGVWRKATRADLEFFSAVGYYFARSLEAVLGVPVGIVGCFDHAEDGLVQAGAEVSALEVLREGEPVPFHASVRDDLLVIALDGPADGPLEVRFAQSNWFRTNLYNGAGIPALPFSVTC